MKDGTFEDEPVDSQVCRVCGCDDMHPCRRADGSPCWWVEDDLCIECLLPLTLVHGYSEAEASAFLRARSAGKAAA